MSSLYRLILLGMLTMTVTATDEVWIGDADLAQRAARLAIGEVMILHGLELDEDLADQQARLERFEVFRPGARIHITGEDGVRIEAPPNTAWFKGTIPGRPFARVFMSVRENGTVQGLISETGRYWMLGNEGSGMYQRQLEPEELDPLDGKQLCLSESLPTREASQSGKPTRLWKDARGLSYTAVVAVETDFEFYELFGNTTDATNYIGTLIGFSSTIYSDETSTSLLVGDTFLYTNSGDPWNETATDCGLYDFGRYWNDNRGGVERTIAHFLSGKNVNAGIAWVGVLCRSAFNVNVSAGSGCGFSGIDNFGGAYGYTSGLDANFNPNSPAPVWDIVAVAHEIGHNFNSPHTMCYANLEGNPNHIDTCVNQCSDNTCQCGANDLPVNCPGAGMGCGTIMSYCHLISPGLSNISLTFGLGHPYGIAPDRVPTRMNAHVVNRANTVPGCLENASFPALLGDWPDGINVLGLIQAL